MIKRRWTSRKSMQKLSRVHPWGLQLITWLSRRYCFCNTPFSKCFQFSLQSRRFLIPPVGRALSKTSVSGLVNIYPAVQALLWSGTLDKYFLAPILHSCQIQDGGLIRKYVHSRVENMPALQGRQVNIRLRDVKWKLPFLPNSHHNVQTKNKTALTTDFIDPIDLYIKILLFCDQNSTLMLSIVNDDCYILWNVCHVPGRKQKGYK